MPFPVLVYTCTSCLSKYREENVYEETRLIMGLDFVKENIFLIAEEGQMYLIYCIFFS